VPAAGPYSDVGPSTSNSSIVCSTATGLVIFYPPIFYRQTGKAVKDPGVKDEGPKPGFENPCLRSIKKIFQNSHPNKPLSQSWLCRYFIPCSDSLKEIFENRLRASESVCHENI